MSWGVGAMRDGEGRAAGEMLGRAFAENPVAKACLSFCDRETRRSRVAWLNRGLVEAARRAGTIEVVREGDQVVGAQLSFAPGTWPLRASVYPWMAGGALGTGVRGAWRYARYDHEVHPFHPREPHFYLWVLGVEPALQGRGVGSALLRAFCARADAARMLAYLETDRWESVLLYQRHGFEVAQEVTIPALGDLRAWMMRRAAR
ncbi:GNAT family N-acetyltransferase [Sandaracinus amylolyticus]|uniref:GNAT family N-acetyltransferase n=1 Tax=Sandaracinus amylolyticus TaxID=927083 RepID=UPI001F3E98D0|nr:GNAT family N-acetyltransferase [Sandaracinus amylolyticus]UJR84791.1 Hypothetical protein I5071_68700 [Sandaracinus amylolyticus]